MYLIVILIMIIIKINETRYVECLTSALDLLNVAQRNRGGPSETIWKVIGRNFCLTFKVDQSDIWLSSPGIARYIVRPFYAKFYLFTTEYVNTNGP